MLALAVRESAEEELSSESPFFFSSVSPKSGCFIAF